MATYQGPPPEGWPAGGYQQPPVQRPTNTLAIVALVSAFLIPVAGIICGVIARKQIKQTGEQGDGLALAGIIISAVYIALGILSLLFFFVIFGAILTTEGGFDLPTPSPFPTA